MGAIDDRHAAARDGYMTPNWRKRTMWGLSRNRVKNYSKGPLCDLPGVTPGTASAAMKRPF